MNNLSRDCVAALGPRGTYSELAALRFIEYSGAGLQVSLFPTIRKAFMAAGRDCTYGVLPIENMTEGHVQQTLDLLLGDGPVIIHEMNLPVRFSFIANSKSMDGVKTVYAQFVTQGQCQEFLERLSVPVVTTPSNGESLSLMLKGGGGEGAIVPRHMVEDAAAFPLFIENVSDYPNNQTRFIVLADKGLPFKERITYKTSLAVISAPDRPGTLSGILNVFSENGVNLTSIISRPTKESMGKYHFFIDIEGHAEDPRIKSILKKVASRSELRVLGSYSMIK